MKTNDSLKREVVKNILIENGVPMKLVTQLKCVKMKHSLVHIGKHLYSSSHIQNDLKQRDAL
jgi:hypothetical protein